MNNVWLQDMINVVHAYSKKWRFETNVTKIAVVVFRNEKTFDGEWSWGNSALPHLDNYKYLEVKFTYNGHWDTHIICTTPSIDVWSMAEMLLAANS